MEKILNLTQHALASPRKNDGLSDPDFPYQTEKIRMLCREAETAPETRLPSLATSLVDYAASLQWVEVFTPFEDDMHAGFPLPTIGMWDENHHAFKHARIEEGRFAPFLRKALKVRGITEA